MGNYFVYFVTFVNLFSCSRNSVNKGVLPAGPGQNKDANPANCQLDGINLKDGESQIFFATKEDIECRGELRTCRSGTVLGTPIFEFAQCSQLKSCTPLDPTANATFNNTNFASKWLRAEGAWSAEPAKRYVDGGSEECSYRCLDGYIWDESNAGCIKDVLGDDDSSNREEKIPTPPVNNPSAQPGGTPNDLPPHHDGGTAHDSVLPEGVIYLEELGSYKVGWRRDQTLNVLPAWSGRDEYYSGISYHFEYRKVRNSSGAIETEKNKRSLLLTPPLKLPNWSKTWVDYSFRIPAEKSATLSFDIGLDYRSKAFGDAHKSEVKFQAWIKAEDGKFALAMTRTKTDDQWDPINIPLSHFAGKDVVLRLEVESAEKLNCTLPDTLTNGTVVQKRNCDGSYFAEPRIVIGSGSSSVTPKVERLKQLASRKAALAVKNISLLGLSNVSDNGVVPGNLLPYTRSVSKNGNIVTLKYEGADATVVWRWEPLTGTLDDLQVQVDGGRWYQPTAGGGVLLPSNTDPQLSTIATGGRLGWLGAFNTHMAFRWDYGRLSVLWTIGIIGKALTIRAQWTTPANLTGDEISPVGFSLGRFDGATFRRDVEIPYLTGFVNYLPREHLFANRYLDWTESQGSVHLFQGQTTYNKKTNGERNRLDESGFVTISPHLPEVLPNIPLPPSPHINTLAPKIVLDIWRHKRVGGVESYEGDVQNIRNLKDNGIDHLAVINQNWQYYGYDYNMPNQINLAENKFANPIYGGDDKMSLFAKAANESNYLWALREQYGGFLQGAPNYKESAAVRASQGHLAHCFVNGSTGEVNYGIKGPAALDYARMFSPLIHARFKTSAAFLDYSSAVHPWTILDHDPSEVFAAMAKGRVRWNTLLFQHQRDVHGGPLLGEGRNHFYWAGLIDGVAAQVKGIGEERYGENHRPLLDFDLLKLHPQMVNHGMGYYERWLTESHSPSMGMNLNKPKNFDKYRAMELAYGHAGYIGSTQTDNLLLIAKEYHLMHAVQMMYGASKVVEISYFIEGEKVDGGIALALNDTSRPYIKYENGLELWVNGSPQNWNLNGHVLPQWGFLAVQGSKVIATTELRNGYLASDVKTNRFADYAETPDYVFADARTIFTYQTVVINPNPVSHNQVWVVETVTGGPVDDSVPHVNYGWSAGRANAEVPIVDWGNVATNGAVKIDRQIKNQLAVFPYPRDERFRFTVKVDVAKISQLQKLPPSIVVKAMRAGTLDEVLTSVPHVIENGRVVFEVGHLGAGRYVVSW